MDIAKHTARAGPVEKTGEYPLYPAHLGMTDNKSSSKAGAGSGPPVNLK